MMSKYAITFVLINLGLAVAVSVILEAINISFNMASVAYAIGAAFFTGNWFAKKENRLATDDEKKTLAQLSLVYMTILGILIMIVLSLVSPVFNAYFMVLKSPYIMMIIAGVTLVLFVVYYFAIKFFFGYGVKSVIDKS